MNSGQLSARRSYAPIKVFLKKKFALLSPTFPHEYVKEGHLTMTRQG